MPDIFGVIADPTRRELLRALLAEDELSVGELVFRLGLSQPTVSKHLKVLRDNDLVRVREVGQHRNYRLNSDALSGAGNWLAPFLRGDQSAAPAGATDATGASDHTTPGIRATGGGSPAGLSLGRLAADAQAAGSALQRRVRTLLRR